MPVILAELDTGDLLVATRNDFTVRRDLRTWEETDMHSGVVFVTIVPGMHGMFLGKKSTKERPDGIALYIPSDATVIVIDPSRWKLLKRVKSKMRQIR